MALQNHLTLCGWWQLVRLILCQEFEFTVSCIAKVVAYQLPCTVERESSDIR